MCACSVLSNSLQPCTVALKMLLCPWIYHSKKTGVSCHFLLQGTFWTQGFNLCLPKLLHWQADSLLPSNLRSPTLITGIKIAKKKYQKPQIYIWYHFNGRKWRLTKKTPDEGERGEWKSWPKIQHSKNEVHSIWFHHFMANRWVKSGNSDRFYFLGHKNHCGWWL